MQMAKGGGRQCWRGGRPTRRGAPSSADGRGPQVVLDRAKINTLGIKNENEVIFRYADARSSVTCPPLKKPFLRLPHLLLYFL